MSAVPFPLSRRQGLSRRSSTCRGDSERPELRGWRPAGGRYRSGGCTSLHLATCRRNVPSGHAFQDPASKARHQLVTACTVDLWSAGVNKIVCFWMGGKLELSRAPSSCAPRPVSASVTAGAWPTMLTAPTSSSCPCVRCFAMPRAMPPLRRASSRTGQQRVAPRFRRSCKGSSPKPAALVARRLLNKWGRAFSCVPRGRLVRSAVGASAARLENVRASRRRRPRR